MANAFACGKFENQDQVLLYRCHENYRILSKTYKEAVMTMKVGGEMLNVKPATGMFPGHTIATDAFTATFWMVVYLWEERVIPLDKQLIACNPLNGQEVDLSLTTHLDDMGKTITFEDPINLMAKQRVVEMNLDWGLEARGYKQNHSKAEATMLQVGVGPIET
jgi:hypothetical protein